MASGAKPILLRIVLVVSDSSVYIVVGRSLLKNYTNIRIFTQTISILIPLLYNVNALIINIKPFCESIFLNPRTRVVIINLLFVSIFAKPNISLSFCQLLKYPK